MFLETKMIYSNSFPLDKNTAKPTDNRQESLKQTNKKKPHLNGAKVLY